MLNKPPKVEMLIRPFMIQKALYNSRKFDIFHPSAWGSCQRKIAYQYYNEQKVFCQKREEDVDLRLERIYDNGHGTHARWQNYLDCAGILRGAWKCPNPNCGKIYGQGPNKIGIFNPLRTIPGWKCSCGNDKKLVYEEVLVQSSRDYNFEGHVDAVIDVRGLSCATGTPLDVFVVDMKTMNGDQFEKLEEPKREHVIQVHIYMWLLDLEAAVVCYENKDNQAVKELFIPRDNALIEIIKKDAAKLLGIIAEHKLPPRPEGYTPSAFPCRGCEFSYLCF